ncbi:transposase [Streptosporangium amethystogenes]|uniref:transposase n=1 Tax=Streptosporangium amethystogenes TaxID=2002 RepID=UPI0037A23E1D
MVGTTRHCFGPEFRAGAVRIVRETGKPVAQIARDLGINECTLYNWVQMDRLAAGQASSDGGGGAGAAAVREGRTGPAARQGEGGLGEGTRGAAILTVFKRSVVLWVKEAMGR